MALMNAGLPCRQPLLAPVNATSDGLPAVLAHLTTAQRILRASPGVHQRDPGRSSAGLDAHCALPIPRGPPPGGKGKPEHSGYG